MCRLCDSMYVGVCAHPTLCVYVGGGGVHTPECGWGLVVLGMRKNSSFTVLKGLLVLWPIRI